MMRFGIGALLSIGGIFVSAQNAEAGIFGRRFHNCQPTVCRQPCSNVCAPSSCCSNTMTVQSDIVASAAPSPSAISGTFTVVGDGGNVIQFQIPTSPIAPVTAVKLQP